MTWKQLHIKNTKLINSYMAFLSHESTELSYESRLKLVTEIGRLNLQNNQIEAMTVEEYYKQVHHYNVKITSSCLNQ